MPGYAANLFPRKFGGGRNTLRDEHMAMLDALAPGWDVSDDTAVYAETYAHALAVTMIWRINGRLRNFLVPSRMMESLPVWEETLRLRPSTSDSLPARRRAVAARMRGFVGNTPNDIYDVCVAAAGANFEGIGLVGAPFVRWPGINPGPPGFEWSSNKATIAIKVTRTGLTDAQFTELCGRIHTQLDTLLPVWMTFHIGIAGGFIAGVGITGLTLIGAA